MRGILSLLGLLTLLACQPAPGFDPRPTPYPIPAAEATPGGAHPTLAELWEGRAHFVVDVADTGLPMGESDTIVMSNGEFWAYLHASARSAGVVDQCLAPVDFPGCVVIFHSRDGGRTFQPASDPPVCQIACQRCPCSADGDHMVQQQYPRLAFADGHLLMVYEYQASATLRRSADGLHWSPPERVARSNLWKPAPPDCPAIEHIGPHPFVSPEYECLAGGPPGIYVEGNEVYIFMALGQSPGSLGCYRGTLDTPPGDFQPCHATPLLRGASEYGPLELWGAAANPFFDFRMLSAAEVTRVGTRFYLLYEGIRGPGPGDPGDSQFALALARSVGPAIDGPWEKWPGNPLLADLPANIGIGHADLLVTPDGRTTLYTSLDGQRRSRLVLVWVEGEKRHD